MATTAEIVVEFDAATQSLDALTAAAYRFMRMAACRVGKDGAYYVCRLAPSGAHDVNEIKRQFIQLVTDENLREAMRGRTEPMRNLILSLAFGSLAAKENGGG
jgi:His-Xaa-Ser system protein HxsD